MVLPEFMGKILPESGKNTPDSPKQVQIDYTGFCSQRHRNQRFMHNSEFHDRTV